MLFLSCCVLFSRSEFVALALLAVRRCRKRKQDHIQELERRVSELEGENVELRHQIRAIRGEEDDPQAGARLREKRLEVIRRFVKAVNEVHALS